MDGGSPLPPADADKKASTPKWDDSDGSDDEQARGGERLAGVVSDDADCTLKARALSEYG
eukprot:6191093-Pleurochrysis_carterae.AAC.1